MAEWKESVYERDRIDSRSSYGNSRYDRWDIFPGVPGRKSYLFFFGSDVDGGKCPYYLFSYKDIMENEESASYMGDLFDCFLGEPEYGLFVDERILMDADQLQWINFADCMTWMN